MTLKARSLLLVVVVPAGLLLVSWAGFAIKQKPKPTADRVGQYASSVDLAALSGAARKSALRELEDQINALSLEERRKWRMNGEWRKWFAAMTDRDKGQFIEATMPSGFKQMLNVFEEMSEDQRRRVIDDAIKQLKETHQLATDREPGQTNGMFGSNGPPVLSAQLEKRAQTLGLKTLYTESSAETKAELAPFLEELQHQMAMGREMH
jgi:hypothetical protein